MLREYELMYIIRPELDDDGVRTASESVQTIVENAGGEVTKTTPWGKRRLAYEVQHLRDGHYVLLQLRLDAARVTDLERALRISDTVFRHLLVVDESVPGVEDAAAPVDSVAESAAAPGETASAAGAGSSDTAAAEGEQEEQGTAEAVPTGAEPVSATTTAQQASTDEEV